MDRKQGAGVFALVVALAGCPASDDSGEGADEGTTTTSGGPTSETSPMSMSSTSNTTTTAATTESTGSTTTETGTDTSGGACDPAVPPMTECNQQIKKPRRWTLGDEFGVGNFGVAPEFELANELHGGGSSSSGGFVGFIPDPDGGVDIACDIWGQDCRDGEKCMPWANDGGNSWNATRCSPLDPNPAQIGDACTVEGSGVSGIDNCAFGAMCFDVDPDTNMGECIEMCSCNEQTPVCNTPNTFCSISNEGVLIICTNICNPLGDDCEDGQTCYPQGSFFGCFFDASGTEGGVGDPCEFINGCSSGNFCSQPENVPGCTGAVGCCTPFCEIGDGSNCQAGTECIPWYEQGQAPDECLGTVGACTAPPA